MPAFLDTTMPPAEDARGRHTNMKRNGLRPGARFSVAEECLLTNLNITTLNRTAVKVVYRPVQKDSEFIAGTRPRLAPILDRNLKEAFRSARLGPIGASESWGL